MKKTLKAAMFAVAVVAAGFCGYKSYNAYTVNESILMAENLEAMSSGENDPYCYSGGKGSSSCSIDGGITILGCGVSVACSVSCQNGYYACCALSCDCIKN